MTAAERAAIRERAQLLLSKAESGRLHSFGDPSQLAESAYRDVLALDTALAEAETWGHNLETWGNNQADLLTACATDCEAAERRATEAEAALVTSQAVVAGQQVRLRHAERSLARAEAAEARSAALEEALREGAELYGDSRRGFALSEWQERARAALASAPQAAAKDDPS